MSSGNFCYSYCCNSCCIGCVEVGGGWCQKKNNVRNGVVIFIDNCMKYTLVVLYFTMYCILNDIRDTVPDTEKTDHGPDIGLCEPFVNQSEWRILKSHIINWNTQLCCPVPFYFHSLGARGVVILFPTLGLSWGFSVIAVNQDELVWKYLFAIFTSLQVR